MSLVTMGLGGSSLLVTGGMGHKDLVGSIVDDFGGRKSKGKTKDLSFLRYTFNLSQQSIHRLADDLDESLDDHQASAAISDFLSDKVLEIDDQEYTIQIEPENIQAFVEKAVDLDEKIEQVMREADVIRRHAKRMLIDRAKKELRLVKAHQLAVFKDDMDIIEILLLADEL